MNEKLQARPNFARGDVAIDLLSRLPMMNPTLSRLVASTVNEKTHGLSDSLVKEQMGCQIVANCHPIATNYQAI